MKLLAILLIIYAVGWNITMITTEVHFRLTRLQVEAVVDSIIDAREILVHYDNKRLSAMESALQYHNYLHYKREHNVFVRMNLSEYNEYFKTTEMWQ